MNRPIWLRVRPYVYVRSLFYAVESALVYVLVIYASDGGCL